MNSDFEATITLSADEMSRDTRVLWHGFLADYVGTATGLVVQVRYDGGAIRDSFEGFSDEDEARDALAAAWDVFCVIKAEDDETHLDLARAAVAPVLVDESREHWAIRDDAGAWSVTHVEALYALGSALEWDTARIEEEREGLARIVARWRAGDFGRWPTRALAEAPAE